MTRALFLLCAAALALSCGPGTSVLLRLDFDTALGVSQLRVSATADGVELFTPVLRPDAEMPGLGSGQTLLVLLDDRLHGRAAIFQVTGLRGGIVVAEGTGLTTIERDQQVSLRIVLSPVPEPEPELAPPPQACDGCAGCCADGVCVEPSATQCGTGGITCVACAADEQCIDGACRK